MNGNPAACHVNWRRQARKAILTGNPEVGLAAMGSADDLQHSQMTDDTYAGRFDAMLALYLPVNHAEETARARTLMGRKATPSQGQSQRRVDIWERQGGK